MNKKIIYMPIVCFGHSGSTLLAMMLNAHSQVATFGEFASIQKRLMKIHQSNTETDYLCPFHRENCDLLNLDEIKILSTCYHSNLRLLRKLKLRFNHFKYCEHYCKINKTNIIVDSSKSAVWGHYLKQNFSRKFNFKFIFLRRSPKACINSWIRAKKQRRGQYNLLEILNNLKKHNDKADHLKKLLSKSEYIDVSYEELVKNPVKNLNIITDFLEINFDVNMIEYDAYNAHHIIGGNAGARSCVQKNFDNMKINQERNDIDWYLNKKQNIFIDNRWEKELSLEDSKEIDLFFKNI